VEDVGNDGLESIPGKVIGQELAVDERYPEDIRHKQNDFVLWVIDSRRRDVGFDTADSLDLAFRSSFVGNT
jgi:hypothetical protein